MAMQTCLAMHSAGSHLPVSQHSAHLLEPPTTLSMSSSLAARTKDFMCRTSEQPLHVASPTAMQDEPSAFNNALTISANILMTAFNHLKAS